MTNFIESLRGYKTYLVVALGVILNGTLMMGYITKEQYDISLALLGFLGLAAVRDAIEKKA